MSTELTNEEKAFLAGVKVGIKEFAYWKDGVQYVGSCGTSLKEAIKNVERNPKFFLCCNPYKCELNG